MRRPGLEAASRIAAATGAQLLCETFPARLERGAGLPAIDRLAYLAEMAAAQLAGTRHLILAGARPPASFFAYPGKPSWLVPDGLRGAHAGRAGRRRAGRAGRARGPGRGAGTMPQRRRQAGTARAARTARSPRRRPQP